DRAADGADEQQVPPAPLLHPLEGVPCAGHVAEQVRLDDVAPLVLVTLMQRTGAKRRAAYQHVQPAEALVRGGEDLAHAFARAAVGREAGDLAGTAFRVLQRIVQRLLMPPEGEDPR